MIELLAKLTSNAYYKGRTTYFIGVDIALIILVLTLHIAVPE